MASTATIFKPGYKLRTGEELNQKTVTPLNAAIGELNTNTTNVATNTAALATIVAGTQVKTVSDTVTAFATGGQTSATQLAGNAGNVTTCATAGDSVKLPAGVVGRIFPLRNSGAASMQVFGNGTDVINGVATATGVAQANGVSALYFCVSAQPVARWFRVLSA